MDEEDVSIPSQFMESTTEEYIVDDDGMLHKTSGEDSSSQTSLSRGSSIMLMYKNIEATPLKKRKRSEPANIDEAASVALKVLSKTIESRNSHTTAASNDDVAFANFIIAKLKQITDENVRIEVEEAITKCIYNGIKKV
ncbi:hypothetical protein ILUMI_10693 [Ignelater luminosus]|uniref:Uncharacterized protein n=1 Tax=Ignelater luminosus TaxID=2038154 RepID=A0A8K0D1X9_IGNLU|nr:hypothetical protein ILUMI_10693 [Ignelater luminosus]